MPCALTLISHLIAEGSKGDGMVGRAGVWADVSRQFTFNLLGRLPLNTVIIMKNPFHKETVQDCSFGHYVGVQHFFF